MFSAKLIISTGRTNAMFTLRETYQTAKGISSVYLVNLSINPDEAFEKAQAWSKSCGLPLHTTRSELDEQLREIERNLEGMTKTERKEAERLERLEKKNTEFLAYIKSMLDEGLFPFGYYHKEPLKDLPRSYITWIINTEFDAETPMAIVQVSIIENYSHLALPTPNKTFTAGTIGKREFFEVLVIRSSVYYNAYGRVNVITMVTDAGACLVSKGNFFASVGEALTIKGTVKCFSEYKGQMQTQVQRIAVI